VYQHNGNGLQHAQAELFELEGSCERPNGKTLGPIGPNPGDVYRNVARAPPEERLCCSRRPLAREDAGVYSQGVMGR
jgi:hypothetical protein